MPTFYFNVRSNGRLVVDRAGVDLPDIEAAHKVATRTARKLLATDSATGELIELRIFEISDRRGEVLLKVPFNDAVHMT